MDENTKLNGNEVIEQAAIDFDANLCEETIWNLIHVIQNRMNEGGNFLLATMGPNPDDANSSLLLTFTGPDDEVYLGCFTSQEELNKGTEADVQLSPIYKCIVGAVDIDNIYGIAINPFSGACRLPKHLLQIILEAKEPCEDDYLRENQLLNKAIHFATDHHAGQLRKGTHIPYILHPLETMNILRAMKADNYLLMAGVLHDTLEDTDAKNDDIVNMFGTDVAALVSAHSEDKSRSWDERKAHAIEELAQASRRVKMLVMADKVSNLRSMAADYAELGDKLWERFNAPSWKQSWYYSGIVDSLYDMQFDPNTAPVYWEMNALCKDVFVRFYEGPDYLLQVSIHGEASRLDKGNPQWKELKNFLDLIENECQAIPRKDAEAMEDRWNEPFWECVDRDLQDGKWDLLATKERWISIRLAEGKLSLDGEDFSSGCQVINGKDEYEYHVTLDEDNTKRLLCQLRVDLGLEMTRDEMFRMQFGGDSPSSALMEYCRSKEVEYEFTSI